MANVSYHIANLLEKMTSSDKDFRFMATNDLMAELHKDSIKLDDESEKKVVKMLLKLLEDKNGEVQNLAVKCLGPLVNKVKDVQVETIVDTLCSNMLSDKEQLRDISSIGLKTVIGELAPSSTILASNICKKITGRLTSAVAKQEDVSVQLESLDILSDLLSRFGNLLVGFHPTILTALLPQLISQRLAVRKRAIIALAHLVMSCNNGLFVELIDFLLAELSKNSSVSTTRTYIQCLGAITRQAGHRVADHLERIMPFVVKYSREDDDELREYCIQAFESFVRRCPKNVSPHIPLITEICLQYLVYDPNYNYDDEGDDDDRMETDNEDENGESDDEYSDDDDVSWKVRRASAKCLTAIISTRHELLPQFYTTVSPALIARFKEREENVKVDIFTAYITLLKQTKPSMSPDHDSMDQEEGPVGQLSAQVPIIMKALVRLLKDKSIKTRQCCFSLLSELVQVLRGALANYMTLILPGIHFSLGDKLSSSNMKIDTLSFINLLLLSHEPAVFRNHIADLVQPVVAAVGDPFYKITSEALLVTQQLVTVIRPLDRPQTDVHFQPYLESMYQCTLSRLRATDIDQEVKERAISCMGQMICNMGDAMGNQLSVCLPIFLERMKNEITRLTAVKAVSMIARSPLHINLSPILADSLPVLASFLRKNQRALRLSTLQCLNILVRNYGNSIATNMYNDILKELANLITENDLHISQLALTLLTSICLADKNAMSSIEVSVLPQTINLIKSPLLQGAALQAVMEFLQALVLCGDVNISYQALLQMLTSPVYNSGGKFTMHKQAFHSIAKCVAALTVTCPQNSGIVVTQFLTDVKNSNSPDTIKLLALLSLGEIGKHIDLSGQPQIQKVILDEFSSSNEEIKSAASYALGNVSVGNLPKLLPFVMNEIEKQPKRQYLLLHSLKEIISCQSASVESVNTLKPFIAPIWDLLIKNCECSEEGTRNVVAECLGKLTLINPTELLPKLKSYLSRPSPLIRSTVITAIKFTISDQPQAIDPLLKQNMVDFLEALHDQDLNVRRVTLVAFNSAAHNKPSLIRDLLQPVLPHLYSETAVRKELIREVEMGPFKHTVDDGLDIRKAAFECMYTLLDSCLDKIDIFEFLRHVEDGLNDHYDIKMLTYLMLVRLASLCPSAILQHLDHIVEPLKQTCLTKVKANSVKQEYEKQDELKRSAMRAFSALLHMADADKSPLMNDFLSQIKLNPELASLYDNIQKDSSSAAEPSLMDIS